MKTINTRQVSSSCLLLIHGNISYFELLAGGSPLDRLSRSHYIDGVVGWFR
jgi:hypothetical protein